VMRLVIPSRRLLLVSALVAMATRSLLVSGEFYPHLAARVDIPRP